jgi:hypothetical protein
MTPREVNIIGEQDALWRVEMVRAVCPCGPVVQFWGDIDRLALRAEGVLYYPSQDPGKGHMGGILSDLGEEPVIRLQIGGLKVGEVMWRVRKTYDRSRAIDAVVEAGYGSRLGR